MKILVVLHRVSSHLVWLFEVRLILDFFQDLMHWFLEHRIDHLRSHTSSLPSKIPLGSVIVVMVKPEIPHVLRDNLTLSLALLLVFLDSLVLINVIHKPTNIPYQLLGQGFPQIVLGGQADLKGSYSHIIKIPINLVKHLLLSV